jgi:ketosteroid isomerase-like protein
LIDPATREILGTPVAEAELDMVRRAYEVFDTDLEALLAFCDEQIDWVSPADAIEPGVRHGHEGVRAQYASTDSAFTEPLHEAREFKQGSHGRVLVPVTFTAKGRGSGMELVKPEWHVWTVRDGKAVRFEWFNEPAPALGAAGIDAEWPVET